MFWWVRTSYVLVEQQGLSDVFNLWYRALEVKGLGEDNLEDLSS